MHRFNRFTFKENTLLSLVNPINGFINGQCPIYEGMAHDFKYVAFDENFYELEFPFGLWAKVHKSKVELSDPETIQISWTYKDVLQALNKDVSPDAEDVAYAKKVLDYAAKHHDANFGISWDTFRAIDDVGI